MNYEKLTVERFKERLEANEFDGLTGARRSIGKARWSEKERNTARAFADAHFAAGGGTKKASSVKRAAKKVAKVEAAPKKAATGRKPGRPKKVAAASPSPSPTRILPQVVVPGGAATPFHLEEATRANSAAIVIQSMRGTGALTTLEQRTYAVAQEEYYASAREAARQAVDNATHGVQLPTGPAEQAPTAAHVTAPAGMVPRIQPGAAVGDEDPPPPLTPAEQAQFETLQRGAAAIPAILSKPNSTS